MNVIFRTNRTSSTNIPDFTKDDHTVNTYARVHRQEDMFLGQVVGEHTVFYHSRCCQIVFSLVDVGRDVFYGFKTHKSFVSKNWHIYFSFADVSVDHCEHVTSLNTVSHLS